MHPKTDTITAENLVHHINILGSDDFEGRSPSSDGETKTLNYFKEQFTRMGLRPGNGDSFLQEVPLVRIEPDQDAMMRIEGEHTALELQYGPEMAANTRHMEFCTSTT